MPKKNKKEDPCRKGYGQIGSKEKNGKKVPNCVPKKNKVMETKNRIRHFFTEYERRFNDALSGGETDVEATAADFAECFTEANPKGVMCWKNDAKYRKQIPKGNAFYRSIGTQSMKIVSNEITIFDDFHAMAKIHWTSDSIRKKDQELVVIEFDVIYMLQTKGDRVKIFAFITGDAEKAFQENGLLSED
jgi:hypothetical protein